MVHRKRWNWWWWWNDNCGGVVMVGFPTKRHVVDWIVNSLPSFRVVEERRHHPGWPHSHRHSLWLRQSHLASYFQCHHHHHRCRTRDGGIDGERRCDLWDHLRHPSKFQRTRRHSTRPCPRGYDHYCDDCYCCCCCCCCWYCKQVIQCTV